jgi:hypothetical protein
MGQTEGPPACCFPSLAGRRQSRWGGVRGQPGRGAAGAVTPIADGHTRYFRVKATEAAHPPRGPTVGTTIVERSFSCELGELELRLTKQPMLSSRTNGWNDGKHGAEGHEAHEIGIYSERRPFFLGGMHMLRHLESGIPNARL